MEFVSIIDDFAGRVQIKFDYLVSVQPLHLLSRCDLCGGFRWNAVGCWITMAFLDD